MPLFVVARDIGGVPVYLYAVISAGPFGLVIGFVGAFVSICLVRMGWTRLGLVRWLAVHGTIGTALAALFPLALMPRMGADSEAWRSTAVALLTGATCGALVGYLAWRRNLG